MREASGKYEVVSREVIVVRHETDRRPTNDLLRVALDYKEREGGVTVQQIEKDAAALQLRHCDIAGI